VNAKIREGHAPAVIVSLDAGDKLHSEAGAMMFISGDVQRAIELPGGLKGGLKRTVLAGESLFLATYSARGAGAVGLCGPFPGTIKEIQLDGAIICERHAYIGHHGDVAIESVFTKRFKAGLFGGEGFALQRLKGTGTVWIHGGGDFLDFDLVAGQTLAVDTGCVVMFDPAVTYDVKMQGGIKQGLFGGEGFFLVHMTGPGHVTLQTLPFSRTARRIMEAAGGGQDEKGGGISGIGDFFGT
jgi:uncharacterized protein (TIGR00266 family)